MNDVDRRSFLRISGAALGIGVLYSAVPTVVSAEERDVMRFLGKRNGAYGLLAREYAAA